MTEDERPRLIAGADRFQCGQPDLSSGRLGIAVLGQRLGAGQPGG